MGFSLLGSRCPEIIKNGEKFEKMFILSVV